MPMRALSMISLKADRPSRESEKSPASVDGGIQHMDFEHFVQALCKIFECPIYIKVDKKMQLRKISLIFALELAGIQRLLPPLGFASNRRTKYYVSTVGTTASKGAKRQGPKNKHKKSIEPPAEAHTQTQSSFEFLLEPEMNRLRITAVYDRLHELVEILMFKYSYAPLPRVLMQVIALKVPFTRNLTKFTIKQCCIDMYTIHELNKILLISNITDICLDQSPLKEANYDILLSDASSLQSLSLSRCNINDIVCERIASRLHYLEPAEPTMLVLNLSSNHITDVGLKYLAEALRGNRHLRYLNISDNLIDDAGAKYIFDVLAEFPLNTDEIQDKNTCYMDYLKIKEALYRKYMLNLVNAEKTRKKSYLEKVKPTRRYRPKHDMKHESDDENKYNDEHKLKARSMALETVGPFEHPFSPMMVTVKEGRSYCIGNLTLCYLNLRYNNLTYQSVQRLKNVVCHQKIYRNEKMCGLVNVLLEGNYVPKEAFEYIMINRDVNRNTSKVSIKDSVKIIPGKKIMAQRKVSL